MKLKCVCLFLCCCLLFCGCTKIDSSVSSSGTPGPSVAGTYNMHLLYNETDTFNPYAVTAKENGEICNLLYDPLVTLDGNFEPVYRLAESVSVSGTTCTVKLKSVRFTDGTALTAGDVIYSMNLALGSATRFREQLACVVSKHADDSNTLTIKINKADPFFVNLLDFPVIKSESELRKSEDNVELAPIGCGRYMLDKSETKLIANPDYYGGVCNVSSIELINAPGSESTTHYVSSGVVSAYYSDYSNNTMPRMSGRKTDVILNNMVYIGVNMNSVKLKSPYIRLAISSAVDREKIITEAYYDNAVAANGPFNPAWKECDGFQTLLPHSNTEISVVNLKKIGYNDKDGEGFFVDSSGKRLSLSLLVNSDNSVKMSVAGLLVRQLAAAGISVSIDAVDYTTYMQKLVSGSFELYLGEVRLLNNMDLTQLVTYGGSAAYGIAAPPAEAQTSTDTSSQTEPAQPQQPSEITLTTGDAVSGYYNGTYTLGDVATAFISEMPLIPLCYRCGIMMFTPAASFDPKPTVSDIFFDIKNYTFSK